LKLPFIPFLWFCASYAFGVVFASSFGGNWVLNGMILLSFVAIFIYLHFRKIRIASPLLKVRNSLVLFIMFTLGNVNYLLHDPQQDYSHISSQYLPGDKIVGEIESISTKKSSYRKTEIIAHYLIRFRDTIATHGKILAYIEDENQELKRRDVIYFKSNLNTIQNNKNPGEFDAKSYWYNKQIMLNAFLSEGTFLKIGNATRKVNDVWDDLRNYFSTQLDFYLKGEEGAISKALILGDRTSLEGETTRKFGNTGAMHVLAVSGLHVGIVVEILTYLFGFFSKWISKNRSIILILSIIWVYAAITGFSASVVRSSLMFTILSGSTLWGRNYISFNSLFLSAFILLIYNPFYLFDIGFQLSYLAMAGIFLFYPFLSKAIYIKNKWLRKIYDGTMVGVAAQLLTIPVTLYYFHQFPNYFMLTNIGLMIFSFLILLVGILFIAFHWLKPLAYLLGIALFTAVFLMLQIINGINNLPGAVATGFSLETWLVFALFIVILLFYFAISEHWKKTLYFSLIVGFLLFILLISKRFENMNEKHICFFNAQETSFVVKLNQHSFCFYDNKNKQEKKIQFLADAYSKIYPSKIQLIPLHGKKKTTITLDSYTSIEVTRVKGGYSIQLNDVNYFLALSENYEEVTGEVISAAWLPKNIVENHLANGAVLFGIE
jgi:competence protein ComEC